jgi:hypothetical protein
MATLWLEHITHQAVATSFIFVVTQMETPKYWHLAWVSCHCLEEGPKEHCKQDIIEYKQRYYPVIVYRRK